MNRTIKPCPHCSSAVSVVVSSGTGRTGDQYIFSVDCPLCGVLLGNLPTLAKGSRKEAAVGDYNRWVSEEFPVDVNRRRSEIEIIQVLVKRLRYEDGTLFWTASQMQPHRIGNVAGRKDACGYIRFTVSNGKQTIQGHRIIFFMHYGYLPEMVDHIDGNPSNNSISNLRAATHSQNNMNSRISRNNTTGVKGVYWHKQLGRWYASITIDRRAIYLGLFDEKTDAIAARKTAEKLHFAEFAR